MNILGASVLAPQNGVPASKAKFQQPNDCAIANCSAITMYERELGKRRATEIRLRASLAREGKHLHRTEELIRQNVILNQESEHRLLNGLQMVASFLSIQGRATRSTEAAEQLTQAASRVVALARIHRHLHALDGSENVEFKRYLEVLCHDMSEIAPSNGVARELLVVGKELSLPTSIAIPLAFIVSELLTNAIKYAKGRVEVRLEAKPGQCKTVSVSDDGPGLPEKFNPKLAEGLGLKIIMALVKKINGQLKIDRSKISAGAALTISFD